MVILLIFFRSSRAGGVLMVPFFSFSLCGPVAGVFYEVSPGESRPRFVHQQPLSHQVLYAGEMEVLLKVLVEVSRS